MNNVTTHKPKIRPRRVSVWLGLTLGIAIAKQGRQARAAETSRPCDKDAIYDVERHSHRLPKFTEKETQDSLAPNRQEYSGFNIISWFLDTATNHYGVEWLEKELLAKKDDCASMQHYSQPLRLWESPVTQRENAESCVLRYPIASIGSPKTMDSFLCLFSPSDSLSRQETPLNVIKQLHRHIQDIKGQFDRTFGEWQGNPLVNLVKFGDHFQPLAAFYHMKVEEQHKNPVWKCQQHRYFPKFEDVGILKELHDALYLSHIAYGSTTAEIRKNLEEFQNNSWDLLYATTTSIPHKPAHFIAIRKDQFPLLHPSKQPRMDNSTSIDFWDSVLSGSPGGKMDSPQKSNGTHTDEDFLEVVLVIRGTNHWNDLITDAMLEPVDYRGGKAHDGILQSGKNLVDIHADMLFNLLALSGKKVLNLQCLGHSLGGGSAAIAAIEFNDYEFVHASAVGFGTPSLLSSELSEGYQHLITTIVADSDIVPRLSGTSLIKLRQNIMGQLVSELLEEDAKSFHQHMRTKIPSDLADFVFDLGRKLQQLTIATNDHYWERTFGPSISEKLYATGLQLEPPGTCIHLFRNGVGFTGSYTPNSFFTEIEFVPSMASDHYTDRGYHKALVSLARDLVCDINFQFEHQALPPISLLFEF